MSRPFGLEYRKCVWTPYQTRSVANVAYQSMQRTLCLSTGFYWHIRVRRSGSRKILTEFKQSLVDSAPER